MFRYKATLSYDGSFFKGFQKNTNVYTVELELERVLGIVSKKPVKVYSSGRTDEGVHALAQVVHFDLDIDFEEKKLLRVLNSLVVSAINFISIKKVNKDFHARYDAKKKAYIYKISFVKDPFKRNYEYYFPYKVSVSLLKEGAKIFLGKHDFKAFAKTTDKETVREIFTFDIKEKKTGLTILVIGNGFLHHQVRLMIGSLLEVGQEKMALIELKRILDSKNNSLTNKLVPGTGLYLQKVYY